MAVAKECIVGVVVGSPAEDVHAVADGGRGVEVPVRGVIAPDTQLLPHHGLQIQAVSVLTKPAIV